MPSYRALLVYILVVCRAGLFDYFAKSSDQLSPLGQLLTDQDILFNYAVEVALYFGQFGCGLPLLLCELLEFFLECLLLKVEFLVVINLLAEFCFLFREFLLEAIVFLGKLEDVLQQLFVAVFKRPQLHFLLVDGEDGLLVKLLDLGAPGSALRSGLLAETVVDLAELLYFMLVLHQFLLNLVLALVGLDQLLEQLLLLLFGLTHLRPLQQRLLLLPVQHVANHLEKLLHYCRVAAVKGEGGELEVLVEGKYLGLRLFPQVAASLVGADLVLEALNLGEGVSLLLDELVVLLDIGEALVEGEEFLS